ncbi:NfeD family protein [Pseudoduganella sp. FT93W]|uniref:NfeD family protein n=1 Tax=Duganella fentianensis TaxID=2692177 RepID=A0A845HX59_9BURK|nr:NfeD family protein [Duganella fentianensis]MYN45579.1 NfeD family protein [Duganella fentianensis]
MTDWSLWLMAAGATVIMELFSGTFYLLMIALGLISGALAAVLGFGMAAQTVLAALVGMLATVLLRLSRYTPEQLAVAAGRDPNQHLDIGQTVQVSEWQDGMARVMYRGALWDVELEAGATPAAGAYTIREVRGSRLIVAAAA